ncbi:Crp/Fnr family transcriptional regulator [Sandaracinus amylolyticus]|uniref:Crp/Fnr family transcriptional regulator n=1 Tax=Sandaracinus amylolyticus TaxID=927083 RepID=UPI001F43758A|nr:Crp/Fnr family transcriptional regulator [Sandaracinus amylolyticus]UJR84133.1 Hypothetical protein I5071_62040 [Sandaracinus amylolyticus]
MTPPRNLPETEPEAPRSGHGAPCVDCPATRIGCFESLVPAVSERDSYGARGSVASAACAFVRSTLTARAPLPPAWAERHAFVLVRRGVLVRVRGDASGETAAIDCAGPGAYVAMPSGGEPRDLGYAATDLMVCLCPRDVAEHFLAHDPAHARDVITGMGQALERMERLAFARAQSTAERRVATLLAAIADTMAPPRRKERLPHGLQQRDLARLAGVRHESFCRVLGELERRGLVRRDRDGLEILDHDGLALAA